MINNKSFVIIVLFLIGGCTSNPKDCPPQGVDDVFTALPCLITGNMKKAVQLQQEELDRLVSERNLTQLELLSLKRKSSAMAKEIDIYHTEITATLESLQGINNKIDQKNPITIKGRAQQYVLKKEIADLKLMLQEEKKKTGVTEKEIFEVTRAIERRQSVLEALTIDIQEE